MILSQVVSAAFDLVKRRIVKIRTLGKNVETGFEASPYGTDSNPIAGMRAIYADTEQKGKQIVIGYINTNQLAAPGEHRIYATDAIGNLKLAIWLKADGTIEIGGNSKHMTRFEDLLTGFNQLKADFNAHVHSSNGTPPTISSTASIAAAKINEIKTL